MIGKERAELFAEVMSTIDSFQQDYGNLKYSASMESYEEGHRIIVSIISKSSIIKFIVDETNEGNLSDVFEMKSMEILKKDC